MTLISRRRFSTSASALGAATLGLAALGLAACEETQIVEAKNARLAAELLSPEQLAFSEGLPDAPVIMQEFLSLTCSHCASFHIHRYPSLKQKYVDSGKLLMVYRDFPLDGMALRAHMLMRFLPPSLGIKLMDVLLKQQSMWVNREGNLEPLINLARLAGMTPDQVQAVFDDEALMDRVISERQVSTTEYGISGTPSFFIGIDKFSGGDHESLNDWVVSYLA